MAAAAHKAAGAARANADAKWAEAREKREDVARLYVESAEKKASYITNTLVGGYWKMEPGKAAAKADSFLTEAKPDRPLPDAVNTFLEPWLAARDADMCQAVLETAAEAAEAEAVAREAEAQDIDRRSGVNTGVVAITSDGGGAAGGGGVAGGGAGDGAAGGGSDEKFYFEAARRFQALFRGYRCRGVFFGADRSIETKQAPNETTGDGTPREGRDGDENGKSADDLSATR